MKKNKVNQLEILAIGLDSLSIEIIKKSFKESRLGYHISFIQDVSELGSFRKMNAEVVFFYSNRQSQKTVQDIKRIHQHIPRAAITLLSPRTDQYGIVGAFRAGLFDFLALPIDKNEMRTVIYRLKLYGAIQSGKWSPERAVLHLFSRPENFSSVSDITTHLNQYLGLFFEIEKEIEFSSSTKLIQSIKNVIKFTDHQLKRVQIFLNDESGLIFGLRYINDRFYFLVKQGTAKFSYIVAKNCSDYPIKDILSDYLSNVLKTSLSILSESKKRDEIKLLSLTDEVTGLYNQRKLLEDLEFFIARCQHDKNLFTLLFIDIDYFKNVNDQFGHVVGGQILIEMAAILKKQLRSSDLVYRYGGDEFIVLLPLTNIEESKRIAVRISDSVKAAEFLIDANLKHRLTLSIGLAEFPTDAHDARSIVDFADRMMYMSKKSGRGKVFHVTEVIEKN